MKKTLIVLFSLSSLTWGSSVDFADISSDITGSLTYAWDFSKNTAANKGNITLSNITLTEDGTVGVGKSVPVGDITRTVDPWKTGINTLGSDWTLSLDIASIALTGQNTSQKGAILSLYSNGATSQCNNVMAIMATGPENAVSIQNKIDSTQAGFGNNDAFTLSGGIAAMDMDFNTFTLVSDSSAQTLTLYVDGVETAQQTNWDAAAITGFQFGSCFSGWWQLQGAAYVDNIYIFNSALSDTQVQSLIAPEPATATLSLLALAGLASRRRRH